MNIPEITLDDLLEVLGTHAKKMLVDLGQPSLMPIYHIHGGDQDIVVGCPWENDEQKDMAVLEIKKQCSKYNATMIGFVGEVWISKYDQPDVDLTTIPRPSLNPDRIEAVAAFVTDGKTTKAKMWQIMRNEPNGVILCLAPMQDTPGSMFSGRMIDDLLPQKNTRH